MGNIGKHAQVNSGKQRHTLLNIEKKGYTGVNIGKQV